MDPPKALQLQEEQFRFMGVGFSEKQPTAELAEERDIAGTFNHESESGLSEIILMIRNTAKY